MLSGQLLERGGVGRVAGLGLLLRYQAELVVEHLAKLQRRVDVELAPGVLADLAGQGGRLGAQLGVEALELGPVDGHAEVLHAGEHADERHLDLAVEQVEPLRLERLLQGPARWAAPSASVAARRATAWSPAPPKSSWPGRRGVVVGQLEAGEAGQQLAEHVAALGRVEQVGGEAGVERQAPHVDPSGQQRPDQALQPVTDDRHGCRGRRRAR